MRLFLLPISTRQTVLYCQRLNQQLSARPPSYLDKATTKAATTWVSWEEKKSGWQKKVTTYGNMLFQRLPHEEYSLKSIPSLSERRKADELQGNEEIQVDYPEGFITEEKASDSLRKLGSADRQAFHQKWLIGSIIGMPISAPVALIPVIPNLPFFYLCFRAWSHWRARSGSQHLGFLMDEKLVRLRPSTELRMAYIEAAMTATMQSLEVEVTEAVKESIKGPEADKKKSDVDEDDELILSESSGRVIASEMHLPEMQVDIDRAVWQARRSINT